MALLGSDNTSEPARNIPVFLFRVAQSVLSAVYLPLESSAIVTCHPLAVAASLRVQPLHKRLNW